MTQAGPTPVGFDQPEARSRLAQRRRLGQVFRWLALASSVVGLLFLAVMLVDTLAKGANWLDWQFLTSFPSRRPAEAGILSPLVGSVLLVILTAVVSFPVGVSAAIYLEEYQQQSRVSRFIQANIANLAGVPSIVYGLLGLAVFVRTFALGRSLLAGALTMSLLVLPIVVIASQEAIRAVPPSIRQASLALGATRWQTIWNQVLPVAFPGILTGTILALSRAIGETAPLITIGALTYIAFLPLDATPPFVDVMSPFTALPIQIYNWTSRPQDEFRQLAAAAIIVLLAILLSMNSVAILLRNRLSQRAGY
jgi:phosphate transport system permease protein